MFDVFDFKASLLLMLLFLVIIYYISKSIYQTVCRLITVNKYTNKCFCVHQIFTMIWYNLYKYEGIFYIDFSLFVFKGSWFLIIVCYFYCKWLRHYNLGNYSDFFIVGLIPSHKKIILNQPGYLHIFLSIETLRNTNTHKHRA